MSRRVVRIAIEAPRTVEVVVDEEGDVVEVRDADQYALDDSTLCDFMTAADYAEVKRMIEAGEFATEGDDE